VHTASSTTLIVASIGCFSRQSDRALTVLRKNSTAADLLRSFTWLSGQAELFWPEWCDRATSPHQSFAKSAGDQAMPMVHSHRLSAAFGCSCKKFFTSVDFI
jgi:hypothetical protein